MKTFFYNAEQFLPTDVNTAWDFFSSAKNLGVITPPEMKFRLSKELDEKDIYEGMLIDYTVRPLLGILLHWRTEISKVNKPWLFTDKQLKGPYQSWEHTHTFIEKDNGVLVLDEVKYQMPLGIIGTITHSLIVRKKIEEIFSYRRTILKQLFIGHGNNNH